MSVLAICLTMLTHAPDAEPIRNDTIPQDIPAAAADRALWVEGEGGESPVVRTSAVQPQPQLAPVVPSAPAITPSQGGMELMSAVFGGGAVTRSLLGPREANELRQAGHDVIFGAESSFRSTTDAGSLLAKSPAALGIGVQRKTSIVNDPRIRGSRVGRLPASGSHWVPARIDLDTALNKFDSDLIADMIVFKGPYSAQYGPEFNIVDFDFVNTPRYAQPESHSRSVIDYKLNGRQIHMRDQITAGGQNWGVRAGYGYRLGNDYITGDGSNIPSSYNSGEGNFALGADLTEDDHIEFNLIRLDQKNLEFAGYAFDISYLVTDGYEFEYVGEGSRYYDRATLDVWYNTTRFNGNSLNASKQQEFPYFAFLGYTGFTDVSSTSTGYRTAFTWYTGPHTFSLGQDFRFVTQRVTELSNVNLLGLTGINSPVPRSFSANPGIFAEDVTQFSDDWRLRTGGRADIVATDVTESAIQALGTVQQPLSAILGSQQFQRSYTLWSGYMSSEYNVTRNTTFRLAGAYAQRAPNLTELYAAQPFMFVLQNGANTVTGDPKLRNEQLWQIDANLQWKYETVRAGFGGFYAWARDYITFENTGTVPNSNNPGVTPDVVEQVNVTYVNTDLATFAGCEGYLEKDINRWLTAFGTVWYVAATDQTRNGYFYTVPANGVAPSTRVAGVRGTASGVPGAAQEPLPSIPPLEGRLGLRLHGPTPQPRWFTEFSARMVNQQNRVAASLLETPTAGFTVVDFRSVWRLTDDWSMTAGVENLGNRYYREHLDFRQRIPGRFGVFQPGATFYFGSAVQF